MSQEMISSGRTRIEWARSHMPILERIRARFAMERPFAGLTIGICLHIEAKTGVWIETLAAGGAKVRITGSPGSTQDDVAAALNAMPGVAAFGARDEVHEEHLDHCRAVLASSPDLIADNGADLHCLIASEAAFAGLKETLRGATEETTTGGYRLREDMPAFGFATWVINDTRAKRVVENRYGVGSSVVDGLMRSTNLMLHGKTVVLIGYGYCGSGVAQRLRGMGSHVIVVDADPMTRLEAHLEGFRTLPAHAALPLADMVVTVTGRTNALDADLLSLLPDGCLIANAGHFSTEIDLAYLRQCAVETVQVREHVEALRLKDGRRLYLVARGNLVNLAAGDGNPVEIMDLGLALQSLSLEQLALRGRALPHGVHSVRPDIEAEVASLAVDAWIATPSAAAA